MRRRAGVWSALFRWRTFHGDGFEASIADANRAVLPSNPRGTAPIDIRTVVRDVVSILDQLKLDGPRRFIREALRILPSGASRRTSPRTSMRAT